MWKKRIKTGSPDPDHNRAQLCDAFEEKAMAPVAVASRRRRVGVAAAWPSGDMVAGAWCGRLVGVASPAMAA